WIDVAGDGPALATTSVYVTDWPELYGPAVVNVLTIETSAAGPALPVLSVLLPGFGSLSVPVAVALLSNAPEATIVAVTLMVTFAPEASEAMVQGSAAQAPLTPVMERF